MPALRCSIRTPVTRITLLQNRGHGSVTRRREIRSLVTKDTRDSSSSSGGISSQAKHRRFVLTRHVLLPFPLHGRDWPSSFGNNLYGVPQRWTFRPTLQSETRRIFSGLHELPGGKTVSGGEASRFLMAAKSKLISSVRARLGAIVVLGDRDEERGRQLCQCDLLCWYSMRLRLSQVQIASAVRCVGRYQLSFVLQPFLPIDGLLSR